MTDYKAEGTAVIHDGKYGPTILCVATSPTHARCIANALNSGRQTR